MPVLVDIDDVDPTHIRIEAEWKHRDLVRSIPGTRRDRAGRDMWLMPLGWAGCLALRGTFKDEVVIGDSLRDWSINHYETKIEPGMRLRTAMDAEGPEFLFPHQRADVAFLATVERGLLGNEPGTGKAQPLTEPVATPSGFQPIGSLSVGDKVLAVDGTETEVVSVHPQGVRPVYRVRFDDGSSTHADEEHLWTIQTHNDRVRGTQRTLTTLELQSRMVGSPDQQRIYLPSTGVAQHRANYDLPLNPYVLGCLLGDGGLSNLAGSVKFTTADTDLAACVGDLVRQDGITMVHGGGYEYRLVGAVPVVRDLGLLGLHSYDKHVPIAYLYSGPEQRAAVLAGLLDTDGTVNTGGAGADFVSTSEQLANDVAHLARSLGYVATIGKKTVKTYSYRGEDQVGRWCWRVYIAVGSGVPSPFQLRRKADLWVGRSRGGFPTRRLTEVVYVGDEECVCIEIAHPSHLYLTSDYIPTHNTASAIRTMAELSKRGKNPFPALVVCPNSVKNTWKREADRFWPGLTVTVVKGTALARRKQLSIPSHIYVMNVEAIRGHSRLSPYGSIALRRCVPCGGESEKITTAKCEVHARELNVMDFKTVIWDECHRGKDPKSKQTRAVWAATGDSPFRYGMSGTPIADAPDDLWPILHWLSPEEYPSRTRWVDRMCDIMFNAYGGTVISGLRAGTRDEFYKGFDPRFRRMTKAAVLPWLPPVVKERREVEMTPKQKRAYTDMQESLLAALDSGLLTAPTRLTQTLRMLQFASSFGDIEIIPAPTDEDPDHVRTHVKLTGPSNKIDAFMDDIEDFGDDSTVVFAVSKQLINLLSAAMTKKGIKHGLITGDQDEDERTRHENDFQTGRTKFILCTIGAGGTGITLTAARRAAFLQRSWSLIEQEQAMNRVHRIGSEIHDSIIILDYISPGTVEEVVLDSLEGKGARFEEIVRDADLLRRVLEGERGIE